ncbi:FadR/GntR family transcriptional regulator [Antarcticirhabdus aurantiaca]|uniref:FCD domain-containing protein n=1 Tax=Antarcticirhabdus aurantiaca TaxID=2606717 RepID=A0ACD4NS21_9HYPH|nr:GntR family transcriptional regulator [Antarcticirhabdus aurantiaca]WAJ29599.1 FCD domain-containing protein [Jeongeuplla avenae]
MGTSTGEDARRAAPTSRMREAIAVMAEYIARSTLKPGDKLPSEHEVMAALGIGRSTVREVMRHFQALGVVETRRGSGSFLLKPVSAETIHLPLSIEPGPASRSPLHALDVCRALEVEAAMMAARRAADADIERLGRLLDALEEAHRARGTAAPEILAFRRAVHEATGNPLFAQLIDQMRAGGSGDDAAFEQPEVARRTFPVFRTLFEAIGRGQPGAAREAAARLFAVLEDEATAER